ncbi:MAG: M20/M25/M40 family metallo-hydrolase [Angelakisella sp.]
MMPYLLYAALAAILLLVAVVVFRAVAAKASARRLPPEQTKKPDERTRWYADRLAKIIRCKTVSNREGHEDAEFAKLRGELATLFPLLHQAAELTIFGEGCLIYRLPGKDSSRNIMVMSHHDVVAATGEWTHSPFEGEIADDRLWGRGTVDTKTPFFAELSAAEELLAEGFVPACNLYLGSSHNEEIMGNGIPLALAYFKEHHISFELILDEGGAIIQQPMPGISNKCAMLAVHEKGRHPLKCTASVDFGHFGLSPKGNTPIIRMAKFITEIDTKKPFIKRFYPEVQETFRQLCPYMSFGYRLIFANLWLFGPLLKTLLPKLSPQAGTMLGTVCYFTTIDGGKYNQVQSKTVEATAFLRCVDDKDLAQDIESFKQVAAKYDIVVTDTADNEYHPPADMTKPAYGYLCDCVREVFPHVAVAPFVLPAGSDARHLVEICPCTIRFAPIDISPAQFASVHNPDENIDLVAIEQAVRFYKKLMKDYR